MSGVWTVGRRGIFGVGLALLLGGLAGCSGGDGPEGAPTIASPTRTAAASVSAEPSAAPTTTRPWPTVPPAARKPTAASAEAFVRYFLSLYSYTYNTNDTQPLSSISGPNCKFCASVLTNAHTRSRLNQRTVGGDLHAKDVFIAPDWKPERAVVSVGYSEDPVTEVDGTGKTLRSGKGARYRGMFVILSYDELRGWVVAGVDTEDDKS
ncbi:MAG: DUF6318 family protein [Kineosporiaceae bacterium]